MCLAAANRKANEQKEAVLGALPQFKSAAERLRAFRLKVGFKPTLFGTDQIS